MKLTALIKKITTQVRTLAKLFTPAESNRSYSTKGRFYYFPEF